MTEDYYEVLGVPRDAPKERVEAAHAELARKLAAARDAGDARAGGELARVEAAYAFLIDEDKRALYDRLSASALSADGAELGAPVEPPEKPRQLEDMDPKELKEKSWLADRAEAKLLGVCLIALGTNFIVTGRAPSHDLASRTFGGRVVMETGIWAYMDGLFTVLGGLALVFIPGRRRDD